MMHGADVRLTSFRGSFLVLAVAFVTATVDQRRYHFADLEPRTIHNLIPWARPTGLAHPGGHEWVPAEIVSALEGGPVEDYGPNRGSGDKRSL